MPLQQQILRTAARMPSKSRPVSFIYATAYDDTPINDPSKPAKVNEAIANALGALDQQCLRLGASGYANISVEPTQSAGDRTIIVAYADAFVFSSVAKN